MFSDENIQVLHRLAMQGDTDAAFRYVTWLCRAGTIPELNIEIASELGHPIARMILPKPAAYISWSNFQERLHIYRRLADAGQRDLILRVIERFAERYLPVLARVLSPQDIVLVESALRVKTGETLQASFNVYLDLARRDSGRERRLMDRMLSAMDSIHMVIEAASFKEVETLRLAESAANVYLWDSLDDSGDEGGWQATFLSEALIGLQPI